MWGHYVAAKAGFLSHNKENLGTQTHSRVSRTGFYWAKREKKKQQSKIRVMLTGSPPHRLNPPG